MTIYATGNPIGSFNPKDLIDNAQNLDYLILGPLLSYPDRRGVNRLSWAGIEASFAAAQAQRNSEHNADQARRESEFDADQARRESEFDADQSRRESEFDADQDDRVVRFDTFIESSGWQDMGAYGAGIVLTNHNQYVTYLNQPYTLKPSIATPYTTTGVWASESLKLMLRGDDVLRQELAYPNGVLKVGGAMRAIESVSTLQTTPARYDKEVIQLLGYYAGWAATVTGPTGHGQFFWDALSTETTNPGTCFAVSGVATGRWKRLFQDELFVEDYGAKGDWDEGSVTGSDDTAAFQAAIDNKTKCSSIKLRASAHYYVAPPNGFNVSNMSFSGPTAYTEIICGGTTSLFNVGERCHFFGIQIGFRNVLPGLGATNKIAFKLIDGASGPVAQFCTWNRVTINSMGCGTAFYTSASGGCFSCSFEDVTVQNFVYAAFNFLNPTRTQNTYKNIYMKSDKQPARMMQFLGEEVGSSFDGINFEQSVITGPVFIGVNINAFFSNIHLEGLRVLGNVPLMQFENCNIDIVNIEMFYCTFGSYVTGGATQTSGLIKFSRNTITTPPYTVRKPYLKIRNLTAKGINYRFEVGYVDGLVPAELTFNFVYGDLISGSGVKPLVTIENYNYRTWISDFSKYSDFLVDDTNVTVSKPINYQATLALGGAWRNPANTTDAIFKYRYDPLMERTRVVAEFNLAYQDKATTQILALPAHLNPPDRKFFRAMLDGGGGLAADVRVGYSTVNLFNIAAAVGTGGALASASNRIPVTLEYYV